MPAGGGGGKTAGRAEASRSKLYGGTKPNAADKSLRRQLEKRAK